MASSASSSTIISSWNLCNTCSSLPAQLFLPGSTIIHPLGKSDAIISELHRRSESGCHVCSLLHDALHTKTSSPEALQPAQDVSLRAEWSRSDLTTFRSWLALSSNSERLARLRFTIYVDKGPSTWEEHLPSIFSTGNHQDEETKRPWYTQLEPIHQPLAERADSPEAFKTMNRWLDEC
jgi:hypothetical protein